MYKLLLHFYFGAHYSITEGDEVIVERIIPLMKETKLLWSTLFHY